MIRKNRHIDAISQASGKAGRMSVAELIAFLQTQPQHLPVVFLLFSEQRLLEPKDICIEDACLPRDDGWVQNARPDMPTQTYLMFPGN